MVFPRGGSYSPFTFYLQATTGISEVSGSYYDGVFKCRFTRAYRVDVEPRIFDLQKDWNIMFAHGSLAFGSMYML